MSGEPKIIWYPIWALPNLELDEPVEGGFFALVPNHDGRVRRIKREHKEFRRFIGQFSDTFGVRIKPTLIMCRSDTPKHLLTSDALASFRDLLAVSTVPLARANDIKYSNARDRTRYSNYFWIHPWMTSSDYQDIRTISHVMLAVHQAKSFRGQSAPDLPPAQLSRREFDEPLLQELIARWHAHYAGNSQSWTERALFRSLNMANQASVIPAGVDATIHDFGRISGPWIAAFEILVHPGGNGRADLPKVLSLLESVRWLDKRCGHRRFNVRVRREVTRRNVACWLYQLLYQCRNDFLHGNPVNYSSLRTPHSKRSLLQLAPVLYRLALTAFLDLAFKKQNAALSNRKSTIEDALEKSHFERFQRGFEEVLLLSKISAKEQRRRHQAQVQAARQRSRRIKAAIESGG